MKVKDHYDNHLADFYSWMIGDFEEGKTFFKNFCNNHDISPGKTGIAVDLGAGNGLQSIALGEIGFNVRAVDFNDKLLTELSEKRKGLPISIIKEDIRKIRLFTNSLVDLVVCCGDTISHLESFEQLDKLLYDCYEVLDNNGQLIVTFRDYSVELKGTDKFIPVKSDDNRILTCIIDYSDTKITVTDLLHEKVSGTWTQKASSYHKLRLKTEDVIRRAENAGFSIRFNESVNRLVHVILVK